MHLCIILLILHAVFSSHLCKYLSRSCIEGKLAEVQRATFLQWRPSEFSKFSQLSHLTETALFLLTFKTYKRQTYANDSSCYEVKLFTEQTTGAVMKQNCSQCKRQQLLCSKTVHSSVLFGDYNSVHLQCAGNCQVRLET